MQLLHDNYGITLEAAAPDDTEPWQQQPDGRAKLDSAKFPPTAAAESMQHQATQTEAGSLTVLLKESGAIENPAPEQCGNRGQDQPAIPARAGPGEADGQHS